MRVAIPLLLAFSLGCNEDIVTPCVECGSGTVVDVTTRTFAIGDGAKVRVDNFAGRLIWRTGEPGIVRVTATRRANDRDDGESIELDMRLRPEGLVITTRNPQHLRNASVEIELTAPAGTIPHLATGVGDIDYTGRPSGHSHFSSGVGSIRLRLPADIGITVELSAAVGSIRSDFVLDEVAWNQPGVQCGRIGSGEEGQVTARTAVGNVYLLRDQDHSAWRRRDPRHGDLQDCLVDASIG
jgi:hypothetical protein